MHLSMLSRGEGGGGGVGDFDILSKIFVKNHSPGTTYFVKKNTKKPHPRAGELCQIFLSRGKLFILGIHHDQTRQKIVRRYKPTKNRNHSSNQLHEINKIIKTVLYTDDITVAVNDEHSAKILFVIIEKFKKLSGLEINREKTYGMWLGSDKNSKQWPFGIKWPGKPIKTLGVYFVKICYNLTAGVCFR